MIMWLFILKILNVYFNMQLEYVLDHSKRDISEGASRRDIETAIKKTNILIKTLELCLSSLLAPSEISLKETSCSKISSPKLDARISRICEGGDVDYDKELYIKILKASKGNSRSKDVGYYSINDKKRVSMKKAGHTYIYYTIDCLEPIRICGTSKKEINQTLKKIGKGSIDNIKSDVFVKVCAPPRK